MASRNRIIFTINGGAGKNIMATAVTRALRKKNPDAEIIVTSPYLAVWERNPDINLAVDLEKYPNFYTEFIKGANATIFKKEPYWENDFIHRKKHLIDIWCEMCGVTWDKKMPTISISDAEKEQVQRKLPEGKLFFIQTNGGAPIQKYPISWARDLPLDIAEKVVEKMNEKGYTSVHLSRENQPELKGTVRPKLTLREMLVAITFSDKRLFIDSIAQHAAAAFEMPSVVVWIVNDPKIFGYDIHENIMANGKEVFRHYIDSYIEKNDITGALHQYPFHDGKIFDADSIIKKLI